MAETVVKFLLDNLASFLKEEVNLSSGVRKEAEYIRDELQLMVAFLRVADTKEDGDPQLKAWVKLVRDVAHDIEDILDEFKFHLGYQHGSGFPAFLQKMYHVIKDMDIRRHIASRIRGIRSRLRNNSEAHKRFLDKYDAAMNQGSQSRNADGDSWYDPRGDALLLDESELVGLSESKGYLIRCLFSDDPNVKVISVVGMGGLGKTTLVRKVYEESEVQKQFQSHAWITVSHSYKIVDLLKDLIEQLFNEMKEPIPLEVNNNGDRLKMLIKDFLQQRKYLIIFDDIWDIDAWEAIKNALPASDFGSRVIITTRFADINGAAATTSSSNQSEDNVYNLKPLSTSDSWNLFQRKAFKGRPFPPFLREVAEKILRKCEGLPLAIVAVGGLLATKDRTRAEWELVHGSLGAELEGNDRLKNLKKILLLSYNDLPYHLKACFLHLTIFPEDTHIECTRLIRLWVAEGFVEDKGGLTLEEVAKSYLYDLLNRSLIQVARVTVDGRVWPERTRRLAVYKNLDNINQSMVASGLRSLLFFGVQELPSISFETLFAGGGPWLLKVLELRGAACERVPDEVAEFHYLSYLSLRDTKVRIIPPSIVKFKNLETLDLRNTRVTKLPHKIANLQNLRHLLVYRHEQAASSYYRSTYGFEAPAGIGALLSLQSLCCIEDPTSDIIRSLGKLIHLRKLSILKLRGEHGTVLCDSLQKMTNLRSLSINSMDGKPILDLRDIVSPPQLIRRLYLNGQLFWLPRWLSSLYDLTRVCLHGSQLRGDPFQLLGGLHSLVDLQLIGAYNGAEIHFKAGRFQKLKYLWLDGLERLMTMTLEEGTMISLQGLTVKSCPFFKELPSGFEYLTELKDLYLIDMPVELIKRLNRDTGGEDYGKIAHIPKVFVSFLKMGSQIGYYL